ncbi:(+)-neomenthol dehydrogenase [Andrographis paniculata]|uniref:(+)-neomenthol dehydrogenase n=1 Tax=Andrographis paniculata TaxID=175694 RepID=UPI0021E7E658|nr:(+)-neomenthol dehydrogenase [Andrographis paniculata]
MKKQGAEEDIVNVVSPNCYPIKRRWWTKETVAVVTGANKGIGFALVRHLAGFGLNVVLTARSPARGLQAVRSLRREGLHCHFHPLDVSDPNSIQHFALWFRRTFGVLDILINNAGVSFNGIQENSVEQAETVLQTNFYGPKILTEALLPIFRRSSNKARIFNISSRLGSINKLKNPELKEKLLDEDGELSEKHIESMSRSFLESVKNGTWRSHGWPKVWTDYAVSKLALNAYSRVLSKRYKAHGLSVNCFCPGFTQTAMTGGVGTHTADAVAEVGARLVLLPPDDLATGKFYLFGSSYNSSKL